MPVKIPNCMLPEKNNKQPKNTINPNFNKNDYGRKSILKNSLIFNILLNSIKFSDPRCALIIKKVP